MSNYKDKTLEKLINDLVIIKEQEKTKDDWRIPYDYTEERPRLQLPVPLPERDESKKEVVPEEKRVIIIDL
jgi:hypothetical protein